MLHGDEIYWCYNCYVLLPSYECILLTQTIMHTQNLQQLPELGVEEIPNHWALHEKSLQCFG